MKIYRLQSRVEVEGELISINDGSSRISRYFVQNVGSGEFLQFTTARGSAGYPYSVASMSETDFLEAVLPIPIFSARAKAVLQAPLAGEMDFHPIVISVGGQEVDFYLGRTNVTCALLDEAKSTYRLLAGARIPDTDIYNKVIDALFLIARDAKYPARLAVSERFVELCNAANLNIGFALLPQEATESIQRG